MTGSRFLNSRTYIVYRHKNLSIFQPSNCMDALKRNFSEKLIDEWWGKDLSNSTRYRRENLSFQCFDTREIFQKKIDDQIDRLVHWSKT